MHMIQMMMSELGDVGEFEVEAWAAEMTDHAKELLARDGHAAPVLLFLLLHPEDPRRVAQGALPLGQFFAGNSYEEVQANKDEMVSVVSGLLEQMNAFACLMISEAWMKMEQTSRPFEELEEEVEKAGGVEKLPGRIEALIATLETPTSRQCRSWKIERDEEGGVRAGDEIGMMGFTGRFAQFLRPLPEGISN